MSDDDVIRLSHDSATGRIYDNRGHEYRLQDVAEVARIVAERDAYLAYAALLQMEATMTPDFKQWTPEDAVAHAASQAMLTMAEASRRGWSAKCVAELIDCRVAVRERNILKPP
jgi:hypothetical protein